MYLCILFLFIIYLSFLISFISILPPYFYTNISQEVLMSRHIRIKSGARVYHIVIKGADRQLLLFLHTAWCPIMFTFLCGTRKRLHLKRFSATSIQRMLFGLTWNTIAPVFPGWSRCPGWYRSIPKFSFQFCMYSMFRHRTSALSPSQWCGTGNYSGNQSLFIYHRFSKTFTFR